ncbi:chitobiase/beta-hexosaminidase C-terminal domain-containing protein [Dethiobacter alkaliphilus]|uniref:GH29D-like beta-sandwich domain-containing protein n=1 Tax=Dethiobacter alkaliphilus AHT 1 TaxID=555088 RepID=C0GGR9_DETAL|nr:chitobiase/beta-hexosaminidase C-terminal domain-containing protein [Dethiobacter alkaliphilus]EEG77510.1 hypothetical protein DealDRAFT_1633 [Dethiobacter alkaliphilus AHT 1]
MKKIFIGIAVLIIILLTVLAVQSQGDSDTNNFTTYNTPGVYGPETGIDIVTGDVVVQSGDVKLQNLHIQGSLYLTGLIEGRVELDNITVDKVLAINSSGETELIMHNSTIASQLVSSATGTVFISSTGSTVVEELGIRTRTQVKLSGAFNRLSVSNAANLILTNISLARLDIEEEAAGTIITLKEPVHIAYLRLNAATNVLGQGTVAHAEILSDGVWLEAEPQEISFAQGIILSESRNITGDESEDSDEEEPNDESQSPVILYAMESFTLRPGEEATQTISTSPTEVELTATSSNEGVATATVSGMTVTVNAHAPGSARILVAGSHEDYSDGSAPFTVTVSQPTAATPSASPRQGEVEPGTEITLSTSTQDGTIYYTTDGSEPSTSSTRYRASSRPVVNQNGLTIRAITVKDGYTTSNSATFTFTVPEEPIQEEDQAEPEEPDSPDEPEEEPEVDDAQENGDNDNA